MNEVSAPPEAGSPAYVKPDVQAFLTLLEQMVPVQMSQMSAAEAREAYVAMRFVADAEPTELAVIRDLTCPGPASDIPLRLYDKRETREPGPAIVFYHGGGFVIGNLESHHPFCTEMAAQLDLPVIAVDYRLAPEHPFPAAPIDCEAATRWIAESPEALGRTVTGLVTCGDSAGGNLALVIGHSLVASPAAVPLIAQAPIYPACDADNAAYASFREFGDGFLLTAETMTWFYDAYAPDAADPQATPLLGDIAASPPTLLVTAGLDPLRDQGRTYAARLIQAGVNTDYLEITGTVHGFICLRKGVPSAVTDVNRVLAHMKTLLDGLH